MATCHLPMLTPTGQTQDSGTFMRGRMRSPTPLHAVAVLLPEYNVGLAQLADRQLLVYWPICLF